MSAESSTTKRRVSGIFQKKTEKRDGEESVPEKKKKHKREPSVVSTEAWRHENREDLSELDDANSSVVKPLNEKEKHKTSRLRFSFRKVKPLKKKKRLTKDTQGILPGDPAPDSNEGEQTAGQGTDEPDDNDEEIVNQDESEPAEEDEESWAVLTAEVVPQDFIPKFPSETKEMESSIPDTTCLVEDDSIAKPIIPKPAGPPEHLKGQEKSILPSAAILWGAFTHVKQLVLRNDKLADVDTVSSSSRYEVGLYVYDVSLAKLISLWSFLFTPVTRASQTSKQILVYWVSSLIKKYPHCFKVQLKKKKQRREKEAPKEIPAQTSED